MGPQRYHSACGVPPAALTSIRERNWWDYTMRVGAARQGSEMLSRMLLLAIISVIVAHAAVEGADFNSIAEHAAAVAQVDVLGKGLRKELGWSTSSSSYP